MTANYLDLPLFYVRFMPAVCLSFVKPRIKDGGIDSEDMGIPRHGDPESNAPYLEPGSVSRAATMQNMAVGDMNKLLSQMRKGFIDYSRARRSWDQAITMAREDHQGIERGEWSRHQRRNRVPPPDAPANDGLVEEYSGQSTEGPPRRYYHLTKDGHRSLAPFREQWVRFRDSVDDILARRKL